MVESKFEIMNAFNHNTILCRGVKEQHLYVFFGKGIGFKKKKGDCFTYSADVENAMLVLEDREANLYKELLHHVTNEELIGVVQDVVYEANAFFNNKINGNLNLTLLDHLNFALERQKQNIVMNYPFLNELKFIYPKEYEFSKNALAYINEHLSGIMEFDQAELGFLVLHIHAAVTNEKVSKVLLNNQMLYECTKIIEDKTNEQVNHSSIYYSRFTKHLEYAIQRFRNGIQLENVMLKSIKDTCRDEFYIAEEINEHLKQSYRVDLDENEIGYLTLHIYNLRNRKNQY